LSKQLKHARSRAGGERSERGINAFTGLKNSRRNRGFKNLGQPCCRFAVYASKLRLEARKLSGSLSLRSLEIERDCERRRAA
jgi:hypothetical protein